MAVADATMPQFEMGRVVSRTFNVIRANIVTFSLLALIVAIPSLVLSLASAQRTTQSLQSQIFSPDVLGLSALAGFISLFGIFFLQAALVHGTVVSLNGKRASLGDCLSTGLANFFPLFLIALLEGLGLIVGFILLIVPGFMLAVMWSVSVPARVVERTGIARSLGRSRELTRGYRWPIFGLLVAFIIFEIAVGLVFGAFSGLSLRPAPDAQAAIAAAAAALSPVRILGNLLSGMIDSVIGAAGVASIYYELRVIKDGVGPEALASVFD